MTRPEPRSFSGDFFWLLNMLKTGEPFAFSRYSDGEMLFMQKDKYGLDESTGYTEEDWKDFELPRDQFYRDKLMESYYFKKTNYIKGICCRCCQGQANFDWFVANNGFDTSDLTWSNLWVNSNYPLYMEHMYPEFGNHTINLVCHENADPSGLDFPVNKVWKVGNNAWIRDYKLVSRIADWMEETQATNQVFLFACSTLGNFLSHQLFSARDCNSYIDVGSTLNKQLGLSLLRGYLRGYYGLPAEGAHVPGHLRGVCIW